jgi:CRP/FNR family cyclic AMP-dependent transcriptional regulator
MNLAEELKKVELFSKVDIDVLEKLTRSMKVRNYTQDEIVIYKGDSGSDLFIVLEGSFRVVLIDEDGDEIILARFGQYDIFGEFSVLDKKERAGSIFADKDSSICRLGREPFFRLMRSEPEVAISLLQMLVARLRRADELIESLAFLNVRERIIKHLVETGKETGVKEGNYLKIKKVTHQEISSMIGTSREAVTKAVKILNLEGYLKIKGDNMYIKENAILY